jgi:hypothetical protein
MLETPQNLNKDSKLKSGEVFFGSRNIDSVPMAPEKLAQLRLSLEQEAEQVRKRELAREAEIVKARQAVERGFSTQDGVAKSKEKPADSTIISMSKEDMKRIMTEQAKKFGDN